MPQQILLFRPAKMLPRQKNVEKLVADFKKRTDGRIMNLITSDEYKPYKKAILKAYGKNTTVAHTGKRGRPKGSRRVPAEGLTYATVHKTRRKGRVVKIDLRAVFGSEAQVQAAIENSPVRSEEHTSELQSRLHLVCRLLLEKKKQRVHKLRDHDIQYKSFDVKC